jgi:triacylglycerol lipase
VLADDFRLRHLGQLENIRAARCCHQYRAHALILPDYPQGWRRETRRREEAVVLAPTYRKEKAAIMPANAMDPTTAVTWGPFVQAAEAQYTSDPSQVNPATITNMPVGYTLVRTIQMTDFFGPRQSRVFYGFVAVGGDPKTAVVALRGTTTTMEWWDDFHWDLVPFTQVANGEGKVAKGFYDIYNTFGTMTPGQQQSAPAPTTFAADVARAATDGLAAEGLATEVDPGDLPIVVTGHSLGGALATLLVADLTTNTGLKPQAWTFASPKTGDAVFAAHYGASSTVSWRIYNLVDIVPYFPVDISDSYQAVTTGYAINSLGKAKWSLSCAHSMNTYLHVLSPATVPLDAACT